MMIRYPYFTGELLNKSSCFVIIKSMHVGFMDWKHVGSEMRLFRLKGLVVLLNAYFQLLN